MAEKYVTWFGRRPSLRSHGSRGCTVTFDYGNGELRTLVASSRRAAFAQARRLWGDGWVSEPCVSNVDTIYNDLTGITKRQHGQDFYQDGRALRRRRRYRRSALGYNEPGWE